MKRTPLGTLAVCLLLVTGPAPYAGEETGSTAPAEDTKAAAGKEITAIPEPQMSPADNAIELDSRALAVTGDPNAYTGMAPGICLVVDDIVRQYCAANPGDISCQFQ